MVASPSALGAPSVGFAAKLRGFGSRAALRTRAGVVTYAELADAVDERRRVLGPTRRLVALHAAHTVEAITTHLAALAGGHPIVLLPADGARSAELVERYDPDVVGRADGELVERRPFSAHDLHPDLALLLSTSGSTGSSKLVRLSGDAVASNAAAIADYQGLAGDDVAITTLPMQYCFGLSVLHSHLSVGASVVLQDASVLDRCFWDAVARHGVTTIAGVPHTFDLLDRSGFSGEVPSLRRLLQAGGRMPPGQVRRYAALGARNGWDLYVMYGQTEATARMAYLPPALAATHPEAVGIAIPGGAFELASVDEADDGVGELVYRGPNVMLGYATDAADLARGREVDALRTGDLARRTAAGLYEVVGRRTRFVKLYGLRVDLDQAEAILRGRGVSNLCAGTDERLVAAVTRDADAALAVDALTGTIGLPRGAVDVVVVDELPRLASGKPDHARVLDLASGDAEPGDPSPTAPSLTADDVAAVFAAVLGADTVCEDDTFVSLGGDSLSYVEASIRLEALLGDLPEGWQHRSVDELRSLGRPRRRTTRVDTTVALRALAIGLVVATHTGLVDAPGGAHVLFAIAGFNFARFAAQGRLWRAIARIAVPAMAWMAYVAVVTGELDWAHVLLVHGLVGGGGRWAYWFVEALVQTLVLVALLTRVPAIARIQGRWPSVLPVGLLGVGLLLRFDLIHLAELHHRTKRPQDLLWLFALGWLAAIARTGPARAALTVVAAVGSMGFFGAPGREALVLAGFALVVWAPTLPIVRPVQRVAGTVGGASLAIYLTHWEVYPQVQRAAGPVAALVASVVVGVAASAVVPRLCRAVQGGVAAAGYRYRYRSSATPRSRALVTTLTPRQSATMARIHATAPTYHASASPP